MTTSKSMSRILLLYRRNTVTIGDTALNKLHTLPSELEQFRILPNRYGIRYSPSVWTLVTAVFAGCLSALMFQKYRYAAIGMGSIATLLLVKPQNFHWVDSKDYRKQKEAIDAVVTPSLTELREVYQKKRNYIIAELQTKLFTNIREITPAIKNIINIWENTHTEHSSLTDACKKLSNLKDWQPPADIEPYAVEWFYKINWAADVYINGEKNRHPTEEVDLFGEEAYIRYGFWDKKARIIDEKLIPF